jgi:hypothetical protein
VEQGRATPHPETAGHVALPKKERQIGGGTRYLNVIATLRCAEQHHVTIEVHGPRTRPVGAPEDESFALPGGGLRQRTPHGGHDLEGLHDGVGGECSIEGLRRVQRMMGIPPVNIHQMVADFRRDPALKPD